MIVFACHSTNARNLNVILIVFPHEERRNPFFILFLFLDFFLLGGGRGDLFSLRPPAGFILVGWRGCRKSKRTQGGRVEGQGVSRS